MIGTTLGHYRILERLGKGGMGEVFLADDTKLGRQVALKILTPELASDSDWRQRFEREARAVAALNHPNIVTIHSVEEADGVLFLTLELVDGATLATHIPPTGLPLDKLLAFAIPLTDAVGAAHQRGITHRDLKPVNVMVTSDRRIKVLDFGLAKLAETEQAAMGVTMPAADLTGAGRIMGTTAYMSPEQAEGKAVDPRSDVFSLGVMLYEMAVGERPFKGDTQVSLLSSIIKDTPRSVTDLRRELPRDIGRIVGRCLAKDPEDRYQTAKDLRNDLRSLKTDLDSGAVQADSGVARPVIVSRRRFSPVALWAALGAVVVIGLGGWAVMRSRSAPGAVEPKGAAFDAVTLTRLTTTGTAGLAAISDDGRYVAYVVAEEGKQGLWLRQVATSSNVQIVPPADMRFSGVTFSPDGNYVYYASYPRGEQYGALYQVPVLGGSARRVVEDVDGIVSFSPDGSQFVFVRGFPENGGSAVMLTDAKTMTARELARRKDSESFLLESIAWSPDGRTIAVPGTHAGRVHAEVVYVDSTSGAQRVVETPTWRAVTHVAWLPDGSGLLVNAQEASGESGATQIWMLPYPDGKARQVTNDLGTYTGLSVSEAGHSFVSVRNELRAKIYVVPEGDAARATAITSGAGTDDGVEGLAWTPDDRLVYTSSAGGNTDIWIMGADGLNRSQLTTAPGADSWPGVTPDGLVVVFTSERDGGRALWRMEIDGGRQQRLVPANVRVRPMLSADGKEVYYGDEKARQNFRVSIDGGTPTPLPDALASGGAGGVTLPEGFHEAAPSPDGHQIAGHYNDREQRGERMVVITPGRADGVVRLPTVPVPAQWAPDSKHLLYIDTRRGISNLWRHPVAGGIATQITKFTNDRIFRYALSPKRARWAIVRGDVSRDVVLVSERK
ncbi:MAG: serine/threonine-protein kinase [Vicinamibacteria bacterium]|nr:serine/threonine-protein kinase [Vicinamibacteria bacterium]